MRRHCGPLTLLVCLVACGGSDGGSGNPGGPSPTVTSLSISPGTSALRVGQSETFSTTANLSNGQTQPAQATWQTDNAAVLTIDANGRAQANSPGTATITAAHQGAAATRLIRVVSNFQGTWQGDYIIRTCDATGDFRTADFCHPEDGFYPGDVLPVQLVLTQGTDQVSGTLMLGDLSGALSGSLDANSQFNGSAAITFTVEGITAAFNVAPIEARVQGDRMTGRFVVVATVPGAQGEGRFESDLGTVTRVSAAMPTAAPARSPAYPNLRSVWRALTQR